MLYCILEQILKLRFFQQAFLKTSFIFFPTYKSNADILPMSSFVMLIIQFILPFLTSLVVYLRIMYRLRQRIESRVALSKPVARYTGSLPQDHVHAQTEGRV